MKKKLWYLFIISFVCASSIIVNKTYGLLESSKDIGLDADVAKWNIKINDVLATDSSSIDLNIDEFIFEESDTVDDGYIAPGRSAYFDLTMDPTGTEVAIKYDLEFNLESEYEENITFDVKKIVNGVMDDNTETTFNGIITLDEIESGSTITIRVFLNWIDGGYDEEDTKLGLEIDNSISIPINISLLQYTGE